MLMDDLLNAAPFRLLSSEGVKLYVSPSGFRRLCKEECIYQSTCELRIRLGNHYSVIGVIRGFKTVIVKDVEQEYVMLANENNIKCYTTWK